MGEPVDADGEAPADPPDGPDVLGGASGADALASPDEPGACLDDGCPLEHVTVEPFPVPSRAAVACFIGVVPALIAVIDCAYMLGAPVGVVVVPGASIASPSSLVSAVQRIAHGGPQLAQAVLSSPQSGGMD
eukprot:2428914-Prymnesium_polylepis.1